MAHNDIQWQNKYLYFCTEKDKAITKTVPMKKHLLFILSILVTLGFFSCNNSNDNHSKLQEMIDEFNAELPTTEDGFTLERLYIEGNNIVCLVTIQEDTYGELKTFCNVYNEMVNADADPSHLFEGFFLEKEKLEKFSTLNVGVVFRFKSNDESGEMIISSKTIKKLSSASNTQSGNMDFDI